MPDTDQTLLALAVNSTQAIAEAATILENMADAFLAFDHDWRYLYMNQEGERLIQSSRSEVLGKSAQQTFPEDLYPAFYRETQRAIAEQVSVSYEEHYAPWDCWFEVRTYPCPIGHCALFHDISARKYAEIEAHRQMTSARCMVWHATIDEQPWGLSWNLQMSNEEAGQRLWPVMQAVGQTYTDAWYQARPRADSERMDTVAKNSILSGQPYYAQEFSIRLASGEWRWLTEDVQIEKLGSGQWRLVGVCTDITDRKRLEAEVQAANARLQEAYTQQQQIAQSLQRALLLMPPENTFPALALHSLYEAASEDLLIGGDFCDAFAIGKNRIALVVGDISGKGLSAAVRTARVKYSLRAYLHEASSPSNALMHLNRLLLDMDQTLEPLESIVCLSLAVVNIATKEIVVGVAGTDPPIIVHKIGPQEAITISGLPLGAVEQATYKTQRLSFKTGDRVLLFSDGITEARRGKAFFGTDGIERAIASAAAEAMPHMAQSVLDQARHFANGSLQDDACLLIAERR